jgi:protein gp37
MNWKITTGCDRLTEGCDSCPSYWDALKNNYSYKIKFDESVLNEPRLQIASTNYEVALGSDLFHEAITDDQILSVIKVIRDCPMHRFDIATKRVLQVFLDSMGLSGLPMCGSEFRLSWRIMFGVWIF